MRMYLRLLRVILCALLRRRNIYLSDPSILHFITMPRDCVVKFVGNDRYHAFMDLGRIDLMIRLGGWNALAVQRLQPFVLSAHIQYRHPLRLFLNFTLQTRLKHWDSRFFWLEHIFKCGNKTMATAISRNGFTLDNRILSTEALFQLLNGEKVPSLYPQKEIAIVLAIDHFLRILHLR